MKQSETAWKYILGENYASESANIFEHLVDTGTPWPARPGFCGENEGLPYELIVTGEEPLSVSGLMKFNSLTAEWECHNVEPMPHSAPTSQWQLTGIDAWDGREQLEGLPPRSLSLINSSGKEVNIDCPPYVLMRESLKEDEHYSFGLYMIVSYLKKEKETQEITEGPLLEAERRRRSTLDVNFKPEDLKSFTIDLSHIRALMQEKESSEFMTKLETVVPVNYCGTQGYKITCHLSGSKDAPLPVDLYVFASVLNGYVPAEGDLVSGSGQLYGIPCDCTCPEENNTDQFDGKEVIDPAKDDELKEFLETRLEIPLATKVIIGAFIRTDWEILQAPTKFFSKMIPSFIARKHGGSTYAVYIDCRMEGKYEYPDLNKEEMNEIARRCGEYGYKFIRFRVDVREENKCYCYSIAPAGRFPHKMHFLVSAKKPSRKLPAEKVVREAVGAFVETVNSSDMTSLSAWLDEDLHFTSEPMGTDIYGKITFLRYFTVALARWEQNKVSPTAVTGTISWKNRRHPCMALTHDGVVTSCTVMKARNGFITEMITLSEDSYGKFKFDEQPSSH